MPAGDLLDPDDLAAVRVSDIDAYLRARGWTPRDDAGHFRRYARSEGGSLEVPDSSQYRDFPLRMAQVVAQLSRLEGRSPTRVLRDLRDATGSGQLPSDRMPEAEVSLRLAFHLLRLPGSKGSAVVALDGAHAKVKAAAIFPVAEFLREEGWSLAKQAGKNPWQGHYRKEDSRLEVCAQSGRGDVVCRVAGRTIRAECKKGPLVKKKGSPEYPLVREALGQLLTIESVEDGDVLLVAVPRTPAFEALATRWNERPLVRQANLRIVTVGRDGTVQGLDLSREVTS